MYALNDSHLTGAVILCTYLWHTQTSHRSRQKTVKGFSKNVSQNQLPRDGRWWWVMMMILDLWPERHLFGAKMMGFVIGECFQLNWYWDLFEFSGCFKKDALKDNLRGLHMKFFLAIKLHKPSKSIFFKCLIINVAFYSLKLSYTFLEYGNYQFC